MLMISTLSSQPRLVPETACIDCSKWRIPLGPILTLCG